MEGSHSNGATPGYRLGHFALPIEVDAPTDVILRSIDGTEFKVHQEYLNNASINFSALYPAVLQSDPINPPVVDVPELSAVIKLLIMSLYYPGSRFSSTHPAVLIRTLMVAHDYKMEGVLSKLKEMLLHTKYLESNAVPFLSTAHALGLKSTVNTILEHTYTIRTNQLLKDTASGPDSSPSLLCPLLLKRSSRGQAIFNFLADYVGNSKKSNDRRLPHCKNCNKLSPWLVYWHARVHYELYQLPITDVIFSREFLQDTKENWALQCGCDVDMDDDDDLSWLKDLVDRAFPLPQEWTD